MSNALIITALVFWGVMLGGSLLWYFSTRLSNSVTVPFTKLTRAVLYDTLSDERLVLGPGTHSLAPRIKLLAMIDTNTHLVPEPGGESDSLVDVARADQVEFDVRYAYQLRYRRQPTPRELAEAGGVQDAAEQVALSRNVLVAYERYDEEGERRGAVQQAMAQVIEEIVRSFHPNQLADAQANNCIIHVRRDAITGVIAEIVSVEAIAVGQATPAARFGLEVVHIRSAHDLLPFLGQAMREILDLRVSVFGMEIVNVHVQDLAYHDAELQKQAERVFEADRIRAAAQALVDSGHCTTVEQAMVIALGQDARYADIVIQQGWQQTLRDAARQLGQAGSAASALLPLAQAAANMLQNQGGGSRRGAGGRRRP